MNVLALVTLFLISAVLIVPISHRLHLGTVLGYLIAGILIGPFGLKLVMNPESIFQFSEFGVIFLMFVIGLELQPSRLWVLRRSVFGLGTAQMLVTTAVLMGFALFSGLSWQAAMIIGLGLSLSSTALVLQSLAERNQLSAQHGRDAFAILLFQDLAVIPILSFLPLFGDGYSSQGLHWSKLLIPLAVVIGFVVLGRMILKPAFKWIAGIENREVFTAASLLIVIGAAALMSSVGLSMGLGAFLAGVLLADSEYRHELEADIEPFKGLLLGLFFISIGMSVNISQIRDEPLKIFGLVIGLYFIKAAVIFLLKKLGSPRPGHSRRLAIFLSPGGEFAFVLFSAAVGARIFEAQTAELLILVVAVSMLLAPMVYLLEERVFAKRPKEVEPTYDHQYEESTVIIAGFGRFGQIIGRLCTIQKIPFTAMDKSSAQVDFVRRFGNKTFYGDASRLDLLHAAKVGSAKLFILAIDHIEDSLKTAELVRRHFPQLPIFARARNRFHAYKLMDLGINVIYRETFHSSLAMGGQMLQHLGVAETQAARILEKFAERDEEMLQLQHAVYQNESQLIETTKQALSDLENLFETDSKSAQSEA